MPEPAMRKRHKPSSPFETLKITTDDDVNPTDAEQAPLAVVPLPAPEAPPARARTMAEQAGWGERTPGYSEAPPVRDRPAADHAGRGERAPGYAEVPPRRTSPRKGATVSINNRISVGLDERLRAYLEESGASVRDVLEVAIDEFLKSQGR